MRKLSLTLTTLLFTTCSVAQTVHTLETRRLTQEEVKEGNYPPSKDTVERAGIFLMDSLGNRTKVSKLELNAHLYYKLTLRADSAFNNGKFDYASGTYQLAFDNYSAHTQAVHQIRNLICLVELGNIDWAFRQISQIIPTADLYTYFYLNEEKRFIPLKSDPRWSILMRSMKMGANRNARVIE